MNKTALMMLVVGAALVCAGRMVVPPGLQAVGTPENGQVMAWTNGALVGVDSVGEGTFQPIEDQRLSTTNSPTFTKVTTGALELDGEDIYSVEFDASMTNSPTHAVSGAGIIAYYADTVALAAGAVATNDATYANAVALAGSAVQPLDTTELNARSNLKTIELAATSADAEPESIRGAFFVDIGSSDFAGAPVWWTPDNAWALWFNATSNKWWISPAVDTESAAWESDTMTGDFTALGATGTVALAAVDMRASEVYGVITQVESMVSKMQVPPNPNDASNALAGSLRYRVEGTNSYFEIVMQTGASAWSWVEIVSRNWEAE